MRCFQVKRKSNSDRRSFTAGSNAGGDKNMSKEDLEFNFEVDDLDDGAPPPATGRQNKFSALV